MAKGLWGVNMPVRLFLSGRAEMDWIEGEKKKKKKKKKRLSERERGRERTLHEVGYSSSQKLYTEKYDALFFRGLLTPLNS
jgi:hypothetical protein